MKVLQIHNYYKIRGGECAVVDSEHKLLIEGGHQVVRYTKHSNQLDEMNLFSKAHTLFGIPNNKTIGDELHELVVVQQPDVAHIHNIYPMLSPSVYRILKKLGIPIVQTLHNYRFLCPNGSFYINGAICEDCQHSGFKSSVYKSCVRDSKLYSYLYARAVSKMWTEGIPLHTISRFIALNQFVKNKMTGAGVPADKISICGNFVWDEGTGPIEKEGYILYLGRLGVEKGVDTLIHAVKKMGNVHLKIAGTGPEEARLKQLAGGPSTSQIEFLGYVSGDSKKDLVKKAKCTVVPSQWYENFPISVVESLSYGTPVIASQIGGLPDLIVENETGLLFEANQQDTLIAAIQKLISDQKLADTMSSKAREHARTWFGAEKHLCELIHIYDRAIADNTP